MVYARQVFALDNARLSLIHLFLGTPHLCNLFLESCVCEHREGFSNPILRRASHLILLVQQSMYGAAPIIFFF